MITKYAGWAREAFDASDDTVLSSWQKLFGPEFVTPEVLLESKALIAHGYKNPVRAAMERAPGEEFIEEKGLGFSPRYLATIEGRVEELGGFRHRPIRAQRLRRGMKLKFKLRTDTPAPFEVIWKVRNRGDAATQAGDLRGKLMGGQAGSLVHEESTKYPGRHYIEVYVVKGGVVVASDHHEVVIE